MIVLGAADHAVPAEAAHALAGQIPGAGLVLVPRAGHHCHTCTPSSWQASFSAPVYRWVDHTSELELEIEASSERAVLIDGLQALAELLQSPDDQDSSERPTVELPERRTIEATASDRPALLAAWLEELLFLAESDGFIPLGVEQLSLDAQGVEATVAGLIAEARPLVKAVTYHRLEFGPTGRAYRARVVFDV